MVQRAPNRGRRTPGLDRANIQCKNMRGPNGEALRGLKRSEKNAANMELRDDAWHAEQDLWHEDTDIECEHGSITGCDRACKCGHPCDRHLYGSICRWGHCDCQTFDDGPLAQIKEND